MWRERLQTAVCFIGAARRYWAAVFPVVCRDLRGWRRRIVAMPDATLRACALQAALKRGNMEGAAIFATFAPRRGRAAAARAAVAFQAAYNYLDTVGERPCSDPVASVGRLHSSLLVALAPQARHADYYGPAGDGADDGGYLRAMVDACRARLAHLPSGRAMSAAAHAAAQRVVAFQAFNLSESNGTHELLARYGAAETPAGCALRWWETGAAAGSSLGVHVLIAAAADRRLGAGEVSALQAAYFPWIGAFHSLLDNLVDVAEDASTGQRNLAAYYEDPQQIAARMRWLTQRCRAEAVALPDGARHRLVLAAMTALYMSQPQAAAPQVSQARAAILESAGPSARAALSVFAARRLIDGCLESATKAGGLRARAA
jgi:tetraprenyl-beta-curcumene synthase